MLFALMGCTTLAAPVALVAGAGDLKIYQNANLPENCEELATIEVVHGAGCEGNGQVGNEEDAIRMFRNAVVARGGNAAVIQSRIPPQYIPFCTQVEFKVRGFAFRCAAP